ncbi:MAG TPA: glycoside hydrolase family protein [Actinocrinis sp.]|nr:glycoside hydrolase family protein [Actinocrinis sp.]
MVAAAALVAGVAVGVRVASEPAASSPVGAPSPFATGDGSGGGSLSALGSSAGPGSVTGSASAGPSASAPATASPTPSSSLSASAAGSGPAGGAAPTAAPHTAKAPAPPPVVTVTGSKKGVGVWSFNGVDTALAESGASWYYNWSTSDGGISASGANYVPMIWGSGSVTASALAQVKNEGPYLLGFNEPDMSAQSNMTPAQALNLWPQLMATGLTLGSPAVAYGGDTPGGWLDQFMAGAKADGYRVNFITLHWYGADFTTTDAVNQLQSYIQAVYNRYHLPIWLTEFALTNYSGSPEFPTQDQEAAFITSAIHMLDGLSYVQRYAWFGLPASDTGASTGLFTSGPVANEAGRAFEAAQ